MGGIVGVVTSVAAAYAGKVRLNAVLPGLVDTPLSWNQARQLDVLPNGTVVPGKHHLQPAWQCTINGTLISKGDCEGGGTGYGCPCEDVSRDDPRVKALFEGIEIADPRLIGAAILHLLKADSDKTGKIVVLDTKVSVECTESLESNLAVWSQCPSFDIGREADSILRPTSTSNSNFILA